MKILIVSSVGGHLTEVMQLAPLLTPHRVVLVINDEARLPNFPFERVYRIAHAERDWKTIVNVLEAARILAEVRPDVILSAGAGPVVPFGWLARVLTDARIVFLESAAAVEKPTLTGRLMYPVAHHFFYQWPGLARYYPRGQHVEVLFG